MEKKSSKRTIRQAFYEEHLKFLLDDWRMFMRLRQEAPCVKQLDSWRPGIDAMKSIIRRAIAEHRKTFPDPTMPDDGGYNWR